MPSGGGQCADTTTFREMGDKAAKKLRSEAAKRNILISPIEGEKKFLGELCELRNFREGYKKYKTLDRATWCAMTCLSIPPTFVITDSVPRSDMSS